MTYVVLPNHGREVGLYKIPLTAIQNSPKQRFVQTFRTRV